jgi:hypothetical protein
VKRKLFRVLINIGDVVNVWIQDLTGHNAKRKLLESKQDMLTIGQLDATIGKAIGANQSN